MMTLGPTLDLSLPYRRYLANPEEHGPVSRQITDFLAAQGHRLEDIAVRFVPATPNTVKQIVKTGADHASAQGMHVLAGRAVPTHAAECLRAAHFSWNPDYTPPGYFAFPTAAGIHRSPAAGLLLVYARDRVFLPDQDCHFVLPPALPGEALIAGHELFLGPAEPDLTDALAKVPSFNDQTRRDFLELNLMLKSARGKLALYDLVGAVGHSIGAGVMAETIALIKKHRASYADVDERVMKFRSYVYASPKGFTDLLFELRVLDACSKIPGFKSATWGAMIGGHETDLVITLGGERILIEVKISDSRSAKHAKQFEALQGIAGILAARLVYVIANGREGAKRPRAKLIDLIRLAEESPEQALEFFSRIDVSHWEMASE